MPQVGGKSFPYTPAGKAAAAKAGGGMPGKGTMPFGKGAPPFGKKAGKGKGPGKLSAFMKKKGKK